MTIFLIAVGIILLIFVGGAILAFAVSRMDSVVNTTKVAVEEKERGYNPALTLGYDVRVDADPQAQIKEARIIAAKQAAAQPRGANMGIGRLGQSNLRTAFAGAQEDPFTAAKIAAIHGWDGVRTGPVAVAATPAAAVAAAPVTGGKITLVAGKDYPVVEILDSMTPAEKRKARIENSKAKSKAMKAAKAAAKAGGAVPQAAPVAAAPAAGAVAAPAASAGVAEPNYIEITEGMAPDEIRKARIHNSKERSKYNKALKAAGLDPKAVAAGQVAVPAVAAAPVAAVETAVPAAAPPAAATPDAALAGIPKPNYIEITEGMPQDELRKARINNAKERSKYNKALKAAGIDPKTVN